MKATVPVVDRTTTGPPPPPAARGTPGEDAWRVLPFSTGTAARQIEQTERLWRAVAAGAATASLRWYGYTAPALVLGVGQQRDQVELAAMRAGGVDLVRRTSGGTTVLVGPDSLALDVALPDTSRLAVRDVVESYRWLGETLGAVVRRLVPAAATQIAVVPPADARADQAARRAAPPGSAASLRALACFGTLSPYEVALVNQPAGTVRKLIGLSQVRKRGVVLLQAGLYLRCSGADLAGLLAIPPEVRPDLAAELERRMASLADIGLSQADLPELFTRFHEAAAHVLAPPTLALPDD